MRLSMWFLFSPLKTYSSVDCFYWRLVLGFFFYKMWRTHILFESFIDGGVIYFSKKGQLSVIFWWTFFVLSCGCLLSLCKRLVIEKKWCESWWSNRKIIRCDLSTERQLLKYLYDKNAMINNFDHISSYFNLLINTYQRAMIGKKNRWRWIQPFS